jgi:hypothetical protein
MMLRVACLALVTLAGWLAGCTASEFGLDPPADELFYPTGLALDPREDVLYVTNGNADLRYNGGTLMALNLSRLREDLAVMRSGVVPEPLAGAESTSTCRRSVGVPWMVECLTPRYALGGQTIKLGNFAGQIAVQRQGSDEGVRLYVPVRGEPSLTWVSADRRSGALALNCGNNGPLQRCSEAHRLVELLRVDPAQPLPSEPYDAFVDDAIGALYLTSFSSPAVSLFDIHLVDGSFPEFADLRTQIFGLDTSNRGGTVSVAARPCRRYGEGPPYAFVEPTVDEGGACLESEMTDGTFVYATSHYSAEIAVMAVRGVAGPCAADLGGCDDPAAPRDLRLVYVDRVVANVALDPASDLRGIAFRADGTRAFVVDRRPPGLIAIDTSMENGVPRNRVVDVVALCPEPSLLYVRRIGEMNRAYVVCFAAGTASVVDADALELVDTISLGQGPNAMAFALADPEQPLGFAANYVDNDIAVIDLLPGSPTENEVIARIGYPSPAKVQ